MSDAAAKRLSAPQFLAWAQAQETGRYELLRGEIVAMAPEQAGHNRAKFRTCRALADAIARASLSCEAFVDGLAVAIDEFTVYEPDALVNCGEPVANDSLIAPSPVVVVEVLSPSTRSIDKSVKLADYFRAPSVAHYLVVDLGRRIVLHYRRKGDSPITVAIVQDGTITLDPPGLTIEFDEIFSSQDASAFVAPPRATNA
jgi:Uma2 family endonuclease